MSDDIVKVAEVPSASKMGTHEGGVNTDPNQVKKGGKGQGNWGVPGEELKDDAEFQKFSTFNQGGRRNSNHQDQELEIRQKAKEIDEKLSG